MIVVGLLAGMPVAAMAQPQGQADQASEEQGRPVNQEQALAIVRANFPGTVISINEVRQDGRLRFRVRLDNEGNIYTVFVDQATGALGRE
ncbi:MAG: PepSY domain-containing protein [Pseudohongiella sp.]